MKIEISKESIKRKYEEISQTKWFSILKKVLLVLVIAYFTAALGFGIAIYGFHQENKLPKAVFEIYAYPAVWVNYRPILLKDVLKQISFINKFSQQTGQPLPESKELSEQIINQLIDTELLRQEAIKYGVRVTKKEVNDAYKEMAAKNNGEEEVKKILKDMYGMKESDFKKLIKDQLMMEKMQKELFTQVKAKHILIKDENQAKDVLEKVKKGEKSFEDLAKEFSEDTGSKDSGGDLGTFARGMMAKEFEDAAFSLEPGKISENLVKTNFGFHIIKAEEKTGKIDKSFTDWFKEIKDKSKIYIWYNQPFKRWFKNIAQTQNTPEQVVPAETQKEGQ